MRTGIPSLVGTLLVILIDLGWAFSGPINWGSGMCHFGNVHLSMVAKIKILSHDGTTPDLKIIPDVSSVSCVNVTHADQYKLVVEWIDWDSQTTTSTDMVPTLNTSDPTKVPPSGSTAVSTSQKPTTNPDESNFQPEKPAENRDSHIDEFADSTTEKLDSDEPSPHATQVQENNGVNPSTPADVSGLDISAVTTDVRSSAGVSTANEFTQDSTTVNDATSPSSELDLQQNFDSVKPKNLPEDSVIDPFLCQYCDSDDSTTSSRLPDRQEHPVNRLTLTITRKNDFFRVSEIELRFLAPDTAGSFFYVNWKNINLFPGPVDATHVCDNTTKLSFNSQSELLLQNVKLAAYLADKCDFPEKTADCNSEYGKDEANVDFCRNAEVILIVIGAFLGVLFLGSLIFYAAKLYCNSRREREARDALP